MEPLKEELARLKTNFKRVVEQSYEMQVNLKVQEDTIATLIKERNDLLTLNKERNDLVSEYGKLVSENANLHSENANLRRENTALKNPNLRL